MKELDKDIKIFIESQTSSIILIRSKKYDANVTPLEADKETFTEFVKLFGCDTINIEDICKNKNISTFLKKYYGKNILIEIKKDLEDYLKYAD